MEPSNEQTLEDFLERVAGYSLTKEQEWELVQRARKGDPFAKMKLERELVAHFKKTLDSKRRANSLVSKSGYINQIIQDLDKYIRDYDPNKGLAFKVYVEQHANGVVQNFNNTYVPGSSMNRNERPLQRKYNMAKKLVEGQTPGGKADEKDILKVINDDGEQWDASKLGVAKKLNRANLRTNFEVENSEGDSVTHRDQFAGGGVMDESYYARKQRFNEFEELARFSPDLTEKERKIILSYIKHNNKVHVSFETNETIYTINKAIDKFERLID